MKVANFLLLLLTASTFSFGQNEEGLRKINGTQLYIKTIGQGEPLLIVHGGPGMNHTYLSSHFNRLSKKFKIIFYDQRASGKSAVSSPDSISLDSFADDIEGIRNYFKIDKLNIFAHSWGVIPTVSYSIKYPDKVKRLIFCNAIPLNKQFDKEMREAQLSKTSGLDSTDRSIILGSPNFKAGKAIAYKKLLLLSFRNSFEKEANYESLDFDMPENYKAASTALYTGLGKDLSQYDYYEEAKKFSFPVLILHGQSDAIPIAADQKALATISKASLEVFKKSGHFIFIEENKKFSSVVRKFHKQ